MNFLLAKPKRGIISEFKKSACQDALKAIIPGIPNDFQPFRFT